MSLRETIVKYANDNFLGIETETGMTDQSRF